MRMAALSDSVKCPGGGEGDWVSGAVCIILLVWGKKGAQARGGNIVINSLAYGVFTLYYAWSVSFASCFFYDKRLFVCPL
jgi:hypothetical protein